MALDGKVAVVTGAALGIGNALTRILLQNGAKVRFNTQINLNVLHLNIEIFTRFCQLNINMKRVRTVKVQFLNGFLHRWSSWMSTALLERVSKKPLTKNLDQKTLCFSNVMWNRRHGSKVMHTGSYQDFNHQRQRNLI